MNAKPLLLTTLSSLLLFGFSGGSCDLYEDEPAPLPLPVPAPLCGDLGEDACVSRGDCTAIFDAGGPSCACAPCPADAECEPCDCPPPEPPGFVECVPNSPCEGLGEAACHADPFCEAEYLPTPCPPQPNCTAEGCDDIACIQVVAYAGCREAAVTCPAVACLLYCEHGMVQDEHGCDTCECLPPPTEPAECEDDADCPGGRCEHFATCAALDCPPPPPSICVYP